MRKKYFSYALVSIISMFIGWSTIDAATSAQEATSAQNGYVKYTSDYKYNGYVSGSSRPPYPYTTYKSLCENENGTCKTAYCAESGKTAPGKQTYEEVDPNDNTYKWDYQKAARIGYIIHTINSDDDLNTYKKYLYNYFAINAYLGSQGFLNSSPLFKKNEYVANIVNKAVNNYSVCIPENGSTNSNYDSGKISTYIKSAKATNFKLNGKNYEATINLSLAKTDGCGQPIKYNITSTNKNVDIDPDNGISGKESAEVKVRIPADKASAGEKVKFTITASSSKTYYVAKLWRSSSDFQNLITQTEGVKYTKSGSIPLSITIPTEVKTIELIKVNEEGNELTGAVLKVKLFDSADVFIKDCDIDPSSTNNTSSCKIEDRENRTNKKYNITWQETSSPDGYVLPKEPVKITDIQLGSTDAMYYFGDTKIDNDLAETLNSNIYELKSGCLVEGKFKDTTVENCVESLTEEEQQDPNNTKEIGTWYLDATCFIKNTNDTYTEAEKISSIDKYPCEVKDQITKIETSGDYVTITAVNNKNILNISKQNINGDEISGAKLKICKEIDYNSNKNDCDPAKTIEEKEISWTSDGTIKNWYGIPAGTYYLVETVAAPGYNLSKTSAIKFTMKDDGTIEDVAGKKVTDNKLVIKNEMNKVTVSKTDMATSKELPGAKLKICGALFNEETKKYDTIKNDFDVCDPVTLADGSSATWTSEKDPHTVEGLPAGKYFLVEETAPKGYTEAESILFVMNEDGTLTDINGKSLANNKLEMKDDAIAPTGAGKFIAIILVLAAMGAGIYYLVAKTDVLDRIFKIEKPKE